MIYELLIFVSSVNGPGGMAGSKILPTEAACVAEGNKIIQAMKAQLADGLTAEFKCEARPDGFVRSGEPERPAASAPIAPPPARVAPSRPAYVPVNANDRTQIIAAIRQKMIDPSSLRVISIVMYRPINGVKGACAVINAKNRFGGYTGNQSMIIYHEQGQWRAGSASDMLNCDDLSEIHRNRAMGQ